MQPNYVSTPRQMIKCVYGLRSALFSMTLILDDSTLMDMDAPEVLPSGSSRRDEPLQDHPDYRGYFQVRETTCFREPLADGSFQ